MDEYRKNPASMHARERVPWVPRVLRPYESDASSLAKLAFLSLGPSAEFLEEAGSKIGDPRVDSYWPYTFNLNKDRFLELTGEQRRRLWLQRLDSIRLPQRILRITNLDQPDFRRLRACEQCLAEGFHSSLHQLKWLGRCFVHGGPLIQIRRVTAPHNWRVLAKLLHQAWFSRKGPWANALNPLNWGPIDRTPYLRIVPELVRVLRHAETWALNASVRMLQWHEAEADDLTRLRLIVQASLHGQPATSPRVASLLQLDEPGFRKVFVSARAAKAAGATNVVQLEALALSRFEASLAISPAPSWLVQFRRFIKHATDGHDECFALLAQSITRWRSVWPARQDPGRSEAVLLQLLGTGVETCAAVRLVETLSVFRSGPIFNAGRHRIPWFQLASLRAAVGPWLTRSRLTASRVKVPDDPPLKFLLDLLISIWVGQTLRDALKATVQDVDVDTVNHVSLANASTGQESAPRHLRRPLLGDCVSQVVLVDEGGQVFALYRDPLACQLTSPSGDKHREQVFEAVSLAEAANQRQWPPGRYVRCSVPSTQMNARVSAILQRWGTAPGR